MPMNKPPPGIRDSRRFRVEGWKTGRLRGRSSRWESFSMLPCFHPSITNNGESAEVVTAVPTSLAPNGRQRAPSRQELAVAGLLLQLALI
jgi:hypothetical protein